MKSILYFGSITGFLCLSLLGFLFPSLQIIQTSDAQVNATFKTYQNPGFGLTLKYPPTWSADELRNDPEAPSDNSIVALFKSPSQGIDDKYLENVIINVQGPRSDIKSLKGYTQDSTRAFNSMSGINIIKSGTATLAGFPAQQMEYTSKAIPGINLKKMQVFTVLNNTAYVVTYGAEQAEYEKNIPDVKNLINSIKINSSFSTNMNETGQTKSTPLLDSSPNGLQILSHNSFTDEVGYLHVVGEVQNNTPTNAEFVQVIGTFYDNNNQVVGTDFTYTNPTDVAAGDKAPFELILTSASIPVSQIDHYNLVASSQ